MDRLRRVDTIAFDKMGTLSVSKPTVKNIVVLKDKRQTIIDRVVAIEKQSDHPLAMVPFFAGRINHILTKQQATDFKRFYVDTAILATRRLYVSLLTIMRLIMSCSGQMRHLVLCLLVQHKSFRMLW